MVFVAMCSTLLFPMMAKRMPLTPLYLTMGLVGGVLTLILLLLPRTAGRTCAGPDRSEHVQSLDVTCSTAIAFETIGDQITHSWQLLLFQSQLQSSSVTLEQHLSSLQGTANPMNW